VLPAIQRFGTRNERDPKVFWYEPNNNWVMVLFEGLGNSIYTSNNLKEWHYESHIEGFWECPELFELSIDGQKNNTKWVMYGASGTYMIGRFDGRQFVPETDKLRYLVAGMYAAQTYNNTPDGRRIQIGWGRITSKGMPFNQMMNFPLELKLKTTKQGPRLHAKPIEEITKLYKKSYNFKNLTFGQNDVNNSMPTIKHPFLHIRAVFKIVNAHDFSIQINGYNFTYNVNTNKLNDTFIPLIDLKLNLEFIIDVNSIEVFVNEGHYVMCLAHNSNNYKPGVAFYGRNKTVIESLEIHELNSIWHPMNVTFPP
jgi:sucrose-6-phosphate hydrolase SacC (GH32 family)